MADDLDDFLKQAAKRRQQRQQSKGERPPIAKPTTAYSEPPRMPNIPLAEVIQESNRPIGSLTPSLPNAPPISQGVDHADERMSAHLSHVFQHEISKLKSDSSRPETNRTLTASSASSAPTTTKNNENAAGVSSSAMIRQLRDPQNMRMAIIAHEILKRPWQ